MTVTIPTVIVGTSFRGPKAKIAVALMRPGDEVQLVREPDNPYDSLAVACHYEGVHVGFIPKRANPVIAAAFDAGLKVACVVRAAAVMHGSKVHTEPKVTVSWEEEAA
jgi:hypothetical protein